jgi:uncharacterized protein YlxW (UPF0749 family)
MEDSKLFKIIRSGDLPRMAEALSEIQGNGTITRYFTIADIGHESKEGRWVLYEDHLVEVMHLKELRQNWEDTSVEYARGINRQNAELRDYAETVKRLRAENAALKAEIKELIRKEQGS